MLGGRIPFEQNGIDELELLEYLGGGGFGSVWKAVDTVEHKIFALKVIQNIQDKGIDAERVRLEAEVSIASEYVVPVVGLREWSPFTFLIVFDYFAGKSLDQRLKENTLTLEDKRSVFKQILYGVRDAHRNNIIHRDLKPANVLVSDDIRVKIIDFGISKFKDKNITLPGLTLGTPHYLAPELLVHGSEFADARSDIYALGQMFFELVTGRSFWRFMGWKRMEDFIDFLKSHPPPNEVTNLDSFVCDFYPNARATLAGMVRIDPNARFSSVDEVISELDISTDSIEPLIDNYDFPVLIIESGSNRNARTFLHLPDNTAIVMGRSDFAGNDSSISRKHLEIRRRGRRYWLKDLGSRNGTMIAGNRLSPSESHELQHGDRIKLGDIFLRFAFLQKPGSNGVGQAGRLGRH